MLKEQKRGLLIVVSGPSGVGKGTVCSRLAELDDNIYISVSKTTRAPRNGEIDGVNYFFDSTENFQKLIAKNQLLEWAVYCDNYYGTPKQNVEEKLNQGKDVILEIEVQGALKVRSEHPEGVYIFILPPSRAELKDRLKGRGTESDEVVEKRLNKSLEELKFVNKYNYVVVNKDVDKAANEIESILTAEKARIERNQLIQEEL